MQSAEDLEREQSNARETLRAFLTEAESGLWSRVDFGRGERDYVRLYIVKAGRIVDVTYWAARAAGDRKISTRGWPFGGGQYDKGHQAAEVAYRAAGLPFDQTKDWNEMH